MPFCHVTLRGQKPPPPGYPTHPETLGEHLKKRRLDLGLRQRDVAERLGVCAESVRNWERGHTEPALASWPAVIDFLGVVPFPVGESLAERIRGWRTIHGVPRTELAALLGVDESTVWRWESGAATPEPRHRRRLESILHDGRPATTV